MKEKVSSKLVALVFGSLAILFLTAFYLFAWTEPSQAPPGGNVSAPVNVGSATQYKSGALGINGLFRAYSDAIFDGKVGIGTTGPSEKLHVQGGHGSSKIRIFSDEYGQGVGGGNTADLVLWASEPGWTWTGTGIGNNMIGSPYYGRRATNRGASYIRLLDNAIYLNTVNSAGADTNNLYMSGGNVGIGTAAPARTLDVLGRLLVREGAIPNGWDTADWGATVSLRQPGAASMASASHGNAQLELVSSGRNTPHIAFHAPGHYGANFGLDTDNWFSTQGWSAGTGYTGLKVGSLRVNNGDMFINYTGGGWGGGGGAYTNLFFGDDESPCGYKLIHANSNVIGWHGGCGASWLAYWDNAGNQQNIGAITANAYYCRSDISLKENLQKLDNPLGKIMSLEGMSFIWKDTGKASVGFTAQDVEKVFPELVSTDVQTGLKSVQYDGLIAPLVEALKEQQKEIDGLNAKIDKLMQRIEELESGTKR